MAKDLANFVPVLFRHLLLIQLCIYHSVVWFHIGESFVTKWARIVFRSVLIEAMTVHGMATSHEDNRFRRTVQVQAANRTVRIQALFETFVVLCVIPANTSITPPAVEVVLPKALAEAANAALGAMVDGLVRSVIVKLADCTKVPRKVGIATYAGAGNRLNLAAEHTHDLLSLKSIHLMANLVSCMTLSAHNPRRTTFCFKFAIAWIMLAAQQEVACLWVPDIGFRCVGFLHLELFFPSVIQALLVLKILAGLNGLRKLCFLGTRECGILANLSNEPLNVIDGFNFLFI